MHPLLLEGLTDAIAFLVGALAAYGLVWMTGYDLFTPDTDVVKILVIFFIATMGRIGVELMRRRRRRSREAAGD